MIRFFDADEVSAGRVPVDGVVPKAWREAVVDEKGRIERVPYELCVLVALRDALRRRESKAGADRAIRRTVSLATLRTPSRSTMPRWGSTRTPAGLWAASVKNLRMRRSAPPLAMPGPAHI